MDAEEDRVVTGVVILSEGFSPSRRTPIRANGRRGYRGPSTALGRPPGGLPHSAQDDNQEQRAYYVGVTTISFFGTLRKKSSPVKMCWFTNREGVCANHSANEMF